MFSQIPSHILFVCSQTDIQTNVHFTNTNNENHWRSLKLGIRNSVIRAITCFPHGLYWQEAGVKNLTEAFQYETQAILTIRSNIYLSSIFQQFLLTKAMNAEDTGLYFS